MSLIYSQSWATGFDKRHAYLKAGTGFGGADPAIPGYPEVWAARAVKRIEGGGPNGEHIIDVNAGDGETVATFGVLLGGIANGGAVGATWNAERGRLVVPVKLVAATVATCTPAPILAVTRRGTTAPVGDVPAIQLVVSDGGTLTATVDTYLAGTFTIDSAVALDDGWHTFELRWRCSSHDTAPFTVVNPDGWIQVFVDGVQIISSFGIQLTIDGDTGNKGSGIWLGYAGQPGPLAGLRLYDDLPTDVRLAVSSEESLTYLHAIDGQIVHGFLGPASFSGPWFLDAVLALTSDGKIWIAASNGGTHKLHLFSLDGLLISSFVASAPGGFRSALQEVPRSTAVLSCNGTSGLIKYSRDGATLATYLAGASVAEFFLLPDGITLLYVDNGGVSGIKRRLLSNDSALGDLYPCGLLRFDTSLARIERTLTGIDLTKDWTKILRVRVNTSGGPGSAWNTVWAIGDITEDNPFIWVGTGGDDSTLTLQVYTAATNQVVIALEADPGNILDIAVVYRAGAKTVEFFRRPGIPGFVSQGVLSVPDMASVQAFLSVEAIGSDGVGTGAGLDIGRERWIQAAYTPAQLNAEVGTTATARTGLLSDSPLSAPGDLTDHSGNGRDWAIAAGGPAVTQENIGVRFCGVSDGGAIVQSDSGPTQAQAYRISAAGAVLAIYNNPDPSLYRDFESVAVDEPDGVVWICCAMDSFGPENLPGNGALLKFDIGGAFISATPIMVNADAGEAQNPSTLATLPYMPDSVEPSFTDGQASQPLAWLEQTDRTGTLRAFAEVDLNDPPDYFGGYKAPWVLEWARITRGLSDRTGQPEDLAFGATMSDTTRFFRGQLATASTRYFTNRPLAERMIEDASRRVQGPPRLIAAGFVGDYEPLNPLQFRIGGVSWLKKKFSRKARTDRAWQPRIPLTDFPDCPAETVDLAAPLIYGAVGLSGAAKVEGVHIEQDARDAAPTSFGASFGSGGALHPVGDPDNIGNGEVLYYALTAVVGGRETAPAYASVTASEADGHVDLSWDAYAGATAMILYVSFRSDFLQYNEAQLAGGATSATDATGGSGSGDIWTLGLRMNVTYYVCAEVTAGVFSQPGEASRVYTPIWSGLRFRNATVSWTAYAGALSYRVFRHVSFYSNWGPRFDLQQTVAAGVTSWDDVGNDDNLIDGGYGNATGIELPTGNTLAGQITGSVQAMFVGSEKIGAKTWKRLLVARHACARIGRVDYSVQTDGTDTPFGGVNAFKRVEGSAFGDSWLIPGQAGWPFADTFRDINGRRYTLLYTTLDPLPTTIVVDVDGAEKNGDGRGPLIRLLHDQYLHCVDNYLAPDVPWQSGPYLPPAYFPHLPGVGLVDRASFAAAKAAAALIVEGGFEGATVIGASGEEVGALDLVGRFNVSADVDHFWDRWGRFAISSEATAPDTAAPRVSEVWNIIAGSFKTTDDVTGNFFNVIKYAHTRDYTGQNRGKNGWISGELSVRDDVSVDLYDQERESPVFEFHMLRSDTAQGRATVNAVARRKLARYKNPVRAVEWAMGLEAQGPTFEPGQLVRVTAAEGVGSRGWTDHYVRLARHELDPGKGVVLIDAYDIELQFQGAFILGNEDALPDTWGETTDADQLYGYLCDETTGKFSNGDAGKALR